MEGGGHPPVLQGDKKPSAYRVKSTLTKFLQQKYVNSIINS